MKVLHQLIEFFWMRGALSLEEAHYLVEHGFIQAHELRDYVPLPDDEVEASAVPAVPPQPPEPPTALELVEAQLLPERSANRGGKPARPTVYSERTLCSDLTGILDERESMFAALIELATTTDSPPDARRAAIRLRQMSPADFYRQLHRRLRVRPGLLADLCECVDDEPLHALIDVPANRGPVERHFRRLLQTSDPRQWGAASRLLQMDEVQTVLNLMAVRRLFLGAVAELHARDTGLLNRCMQRPDRAGTAWRSFALGLLLTHHSRARSAGRTVTGYALAQPLDGAVGKAAWANALVMDVAAVSQLMASWFGSNADVDSLSGLTQSPAFDSKLLVPFGWKI